MFRQLDYQDRVLSTLDAYLDVLKAKKKEADEIAELAALTLASPYRISRKRLGKP